jgi:hypothetical protein
MVTLAARNVPVKASRGMAIGHSCACSSAAVFGLIVSGIPAYADAEALPVVSAIVADETLDAGCSGTAVAAVTASEAEDSL